MIPAPVPQPAHPHVHVVNTRPEHVQALEDMQHLIYPTLTADEKFTAPKYLRHLELFPEGQFTALAERDGRWIPVGVTSTYRTHFDFSDYHHTYLEAIGHGWLTHHDPTGEWLYGVDMAVHPDYRGLRISRKLYEARHALVRRLNLRGEIAGGMMPGYHLHRQRLTIAQYALRVWQGRLHDPTLTAQLRAGFTFRGILYDHITDPRSDNTAMLIVRENPHYIPAAQAAPV
jgi:GNAT superfamily N-acetyltransferase